MNRTFLKMAGAGNDFLIFDDRGGTLSAVTPERWSALCARRTGVGADGVLLLRDSTDFDFRMIFMNSDGIEAEMCGNGARCLSWAAVFEYGLGQGLTVEYPKPPGWDLPSRFGSEQVWSVSFEATDGMHSAVGWGGQVVVTIGDPGVPQEVSVETGSGSFDGYLLDTGVPHFVTLVEDPRTIDVHDAGGDIRRHESFQPAGANANFLGREPDPEGCYHIRTYERGVEAETLSCGTGAAAAATVLAFQGALSPVSLRTPGGILRVHFTGGKGDDIGGLWLEGPVSIVYRGELVDL